MSEVIALVGPTASGKSALAVRIAKAVGGEVVGTDSMQAYQGMNIGTATPTPEEMQGIRHHCIDVVPFSHPLTVAEFQTMARNAIDDILARGVTPIVVGGSGLYVSAVLDEMKFPGTDPQVRARYELELERLGSIGLHAVLAERDPVAAAAILPANGRRIVRALEVIEMTGEPYVARLPDPVEIYPTRRFGLDVPRVEMDARITTRVDEMLASGFLEEVRQLDQKGLRDAVTASRALGYSQMLAHLDGQCSLEEARFATIEATRRFARRQQRWFRPDKRITWLDYDADDLVDRVLGSETAT